LSASAGEGKKRSNEDDKASSILTGTTLQVYRFLYKEGRPLGIREIQRGLGLSSPSVAQYHIRKLSSAGLVKEEAGGYVVDKVVFENMLRIRRSLIPVQVAYAAFYATMLAALVIIYSSSYSLAPSLYLFAFSVTVSALLLFSYQAFKSKSYPK
jgi:predicted DNA-binding transcriptional regulator